MNAHLDFAPTASYLSRIAEPALRTLIVAGAAGVSLAALKISGTKARLAVWRGVLGVAVAMPLLSFLLPSLQVAVPLIQKSPVAREAVTPVLPPVFTGKFDLTQAAQMAAVRDAVRDDVRASEYKLEAEARASRATRSTRASRLLQSLGSSRDSWMAWSIAQSANLLSRARWPSCISRDSYALARACSPESSSARVSPEKQKRFAIRARSSISISVPTLWAFANPRG
jgi:hypothetical protein